MARRLNASAGVIVAAWLLTGATGCPHDNPGDDTADASTGGMTTSGVATTTTTISTSAAASTTGSSTTTTAGSTDGTTTMGAECNNDDDCDAGAAFCGPNGCQTGAEGNPCNDDTDCSSAAPLCSSASVCQDGSSGDACASATDCSNQLFCAQTCTECSGLTDVDVVMTLFHTFVGDITVKLQSPQGTVEMLVSIPGADEPQDDGDLSPPVSMAASAATLAGPITFDDEAPTSSELLGLDLSLDEVACEEQGPCEFHSSGFPGTTHNLGGFDGEDPIGEWTLCIGDSLEPDPGTLRHWRIVLTCAEGTKEIDAGEIAVPIPDGGYDGTLASMGCSPLTL